MNPPPDARAGARAESDRRFMRRALALARARAGLTTPNPSVGCVLVRGGRVVGQGATGRGGRPHAETIALTKAGRLARGATAYVTFEPCAHRGRTPACAGALVAGGITRAVVGCLDPYPPVRGRGIAILRRAGISVATGVLENECRALNEGFITRVTRRRPFGILKLATSLDGRIAATSGDSQWISSARSRVIVHRWRRECDAVVVGAGTVIKDNPQLTCRIARGRDPVRVVIDARLRTPPTALIFTERSDATALLVTLGKNVQRARRRYASGRVEVLGCSERDGAIDLKAMMAEFARRGWCKVLFEGGAHLAGSALRARIIDRVAFFIAPKVLGAGLPAVQGLETRRVREAIGLTNLSVRRIDGDALIEARPVTRLH
ncbi:MAG TPA: bifunctional diaminohydroxyphosphoribosylaminopyrimidine deaminase/5-amino-6-(5-phosphoribosylamino)uracil reductase RibD [Candidatus Binataceae bacterium]